MTLGYYDCDRKQRICGCFAGCVFLLAGSFAVDDAALAQKPEPAEAGAARAAGSSGRNLETRARGDLPLSFRLEQLRRLAEEDKSIHLEVKELPDLGMVMIAVGKRAQGRSDEGPSSRYSFSSCLGTGDTSGTDWWCTGERDVFCGEGVHFCGKYYSLSGGFNFGPGFYRPDGSLYWEDRNFWYCPPGDWDWYAACTYYDPMPDSMLDEEGVWEAKWYTAGSYEASEHYTVCYDLVGHGTSKGVTGEGEPINPTSTFLVTDQYVYSWLRLENYAFNHAPDLKYRWFGPEGFYHEGEWDIENPGSGSWWGWVNARASAHSWVR